MNICVNGRMGPEKLRNSKGSLADLATPGAEISVRVTAKASRAALLRDGDGLRAYVTELPEGGRATREVTKLLARALGIAKSRLTLLRGARSREKVFRVD